MDILYASELPHRVHRRAGLLDVIKHGGAPGFLPQDVIDVAECLFKHVVIALQDQIIATGESSPQ